MSKYYKAEEVISLLKAHAKDGDNRTFISDETAYAIENFPTIEVSEDCISKHDIWKIIEDNAYWVRYNENSTEKGMTLTGINQALNECPPVIPTVSEDAISREYMLRALNGYGKDWQEDCEIAETIKNAPSVVPSRAEGEWYILEYEYFTCNQCGECVESYAECTQEARDMLENEDYPNYCPNCGAKMKRGEMMSEKLYRVQMNSEGMPMTT